jgi:hypothetical protein
MTPKEFDKLTTARIEKIKEILLHKSIEYSHNGDRLWNFKLASNMNSNTPEEALWGMAMKHLVSVDDLVKKRLKSTVPMIDEKIGDLINYLILLEAILKEKIE